MHRLAWFGLMAILLAPAAARAGDIIQDSGLVGSAFFTGNPGQTFTAEDPIIRTIGFYYADANQHFGSAVKTLSLYKGTGSDRVLLAQESRDLAGVNGYADFDFGYVFLSSGIQYFFEITGESGRGLFYYADSSATYAGGTRTLNGTPASGDLRFRVLAVPVCQVVDNGDGTGTIACPGGETFGSICTVVDNGNGTSTLTCPDGTQVTITNGADGSSCSVTDNGNGTKTITCTDGTSVTVSDGTDGTDGRDGTGCSVTDNGNGTATIACSDGSAVTIQTGRSDGGCSVARGARPAGLAWTVLLGLAWAVWRRRRLSTATPE